MTMRARHLGEAGHACLRYWLHEAQRRHAGDDALAEWRGRSAQGTMPLPERWIGERRVDDVPRAAHGIEVADEIGPLAGGSECERARALAHGEAFDALRGDAFSTCRGEAALQSSTQLMSGRSNAPSASPLQARI